MMLWGGGKKVCAGGGGLRAPFLDPPQSGILGVLGFGQALRRGLWHDAWMYCHLKLAAPLATAPCPLDGGGGAGYLAGCILRGWALGRGLWFFMSWGFVSCKINQRAETSQTTAGLVVVVSASTIMNTSMRSRAQKGEWQRRRREDEAGDISQLPINCDWADDRWRGLERFEEGRRP